MRRARDPDLAASGPLADRTELLAIAAAPDRRRATARLRRSLVDAKAGPLTMQIVFTLVALGDSSSDRVLMALADRLHESPQAQAIVRAAAYLVREDFAALLAAADADSLLCRFVPLPFAHLSRVPSVAPKLFKLWIEELRRATSSQGVSAYRAFLGDVAEAAFRAVSLGTPVEQLFGIEGRAFFVDSITAELPGTTDFLAARGMVWLLGLLDPDDAARSAIERARSRFRNAAFAEDCRKILEGGDWPPLRPAG